MPAPKVRKIHLDELDKYKLPREVKKLLNRDALNGKGFDACHRRIRKETGIWIPELGPVFKKLDKLLGLPKR
jgi:hypothetical protein